MPKEEYLELTSLKVLSLYQWLIRERDMESASPGTFLSIEDSFGGHYFWHQISL